MKQHNITRGYIHVYTGNGKGKTTAALGLAFRAMGSGMKTYIAQFMKGQNYAELRSTSLVSNAIKIEQFGRKNFLHVTKSPSDEDKLMARRGLDRAKQLMFSGKYHIVILDEINVACYFNLLTTNDILNFIKEKPPQTELVLTGRYAPKEIIDVADLVTEMKEIKHYFQKGVEARDGIEK